MAFPDHIFKSYDIRGLVDGELSDELAGKIGHAYGIFLRDLGLDRTKKVVVGRDMRPTSPGFQGAVMKSLRAQGWHVVDIGMVSTPLFNFACTYDDSHVAGITVTASHNPGEYNGFKMTLGDGKPVGKGSGMEEIRDMARDMEFQDAPEQGGAEEKNVLGDYLDTLYGLVSADSISSLKIVIDNANGMGGVTFPPLLEKLPNVEVEYMYIDPDGTFPNHEANPIKTETLKDLQAKVREVGADFGLALDGDADRIGLVDNTGAVVDASLVSALIGAEVLAQYPESTMLYDLRSSRIVPEWWEEHGATTEMTRVGHAHIKPRMKETGAVFASELSLHLYFRDMTNQESSELCLLYLMRLLSREQKPLTELLGPLRRYHHSGEINFEVEDKQGAIDRIKSAFADTALEVSDLDGIWLKFEWGWFNVRASNTEPVLRLNLEAGSEEEMKEKVREVSGIINS